MLPHWDDVIEPFLAALGEGPIIEIGAAAGGTTLKLAELAAARGLALHAIDPAPQFDPAELERRFGDGLHFHRERSHDALERIDAPAAALIDGDHNWYTVHRELELLQRSAGAGGRPFPLTFLHDVEWPYARRDMYYEPDAIPEQSRKPWARRGIRWGQNRLAENGGGVNPHLANALEEGGPRNGVLTAIEDFIGQRDGIELTIVRGDAGIGVLASDELLAGAPAVRRQWDRLRSTEFLLEQAARLSKTAARETAARIESARQGRQPEHEAKP